MTIDRDNAYKVQVTITIPNSYPDCSPVYRLIMISSEVSQKQSYLIEGIQNKIDQSDLRAVNNLKPMQAGINPADLTSASSEPVQPTLDSIEDELHLHYKDYCKLHQLDWLLSF